MQRSDPLPPPAAISKRFVQVGAHRIHYRVAGTGPSVVMLHDSPRSSRLHLATMRHLASRFRVVALDTPGYGNSTPIGLDRPTIADFGRVLGATLQALGLSRAPLYATHTSAKIALDYAADAAEPPAILLLDGLAIPRDAPDEAFIAAYMRPFRLDPDGAYLAAEWSRAQDMVRWFPWFDPRPANRIAMDRPSAGWFDHYVLDLFAAGPHYSDAYAAAMRYDPRGALRRVACPTVVGARRDDVLFDALDLIPADRGRSVRVERLSADRGAWLAWVADTLAEGAMPVSAPVPLQAADGPIYIDLAHGQMLVHRAGPVGIRPLLILETPTTLHARMWQAALRGERATIVPELPDYGESDPLADDAALSAYADALACGAAALGIDRLDLLAIGTAAASLAMALAVRYPALVCGLALDGIGAAGAETADAICPAIASDHGGGHLHRIWHMLRGGELQVPWYDGRITAQRRLMPCLAAEPLHAALLDILKQPRHYGDATRAALAVHPSAMTLPEQPMVLLDLPGDTGYGGVAALAARASKARVVARPADIAAAAGVLRAVSATPVPVLETC